MLSVKLEDVLPIILETKNGVVVFLAVLGGGKTPGDHSELELKGSEQTSSTRSMALNLTRDVTLRTGHQECY